MKYKTVRGQTISYAESSKELRSYLHVQPTQLLAQPGSAIAIAICPPYSSLDQVVDYFKDAPLSLRRDYMFCVLKILVQHRTDNNLYSLVGGARELTESFEETAFRELGEETGLTLSDLLFMGMISGGDNMINIYPDGNAAEGLDALYFTIVPEGTVLKKNSETREFHYMSIAEILDILPNWHPAQRATIDLLLKKLLLIPEIYNLQNIDLPSWNYKF